MLVLICKGEMLMLCFLIRVKERMNPIPIPIMRDGGIILTLGMDLGLIPLALTSHRTNPLLKIRLTSF